MKQVLIIALGLYPFFTYPQSISNVVSIQQGNNAVVTYDLAGPAAATYFVKLYYSTDGGQTFSRELTQVSGDIKGGVKPGIGKKIIWSADKEVNYLNGQVVFKVEGEARKAMPKPVTLNNATVEITAAKRNGDEIIIDLTLVQNSQYESQGWSLSKHTELTGHDGKQYKATSGKFGSQIEFSRTVDCIKGVPVRGQITFQVEGSDLVIPAVKILFEYTEFIFKNVAIE